MSREETNYWEIQETAEDTANRVVIPEAFGLCSKCKNFAYQSTKYNKEYFKCTYEGVNFLPSQIDPITKCSCFEGRGSLDLFDMWNLATMIERRNDVGFKPIDEETE